MKERNPKGDPVTEDKNIEDQPRDNGCLKSRDREVVQFLLTVSENSGMIPSNQKGVAR
jgi:hypothetical protein